MAKPAKELNDEVQVENKPKLFSLSGRGVARFRTHIEPGIGPKPRNAFDMREQMFDAELTPIGIYVKMTRTEPGKGQSVEEHVVPYSNIQSIKLVPLDK